MQCGHLRWRSLKASEEEVQFLHQRLAGSVMGTDQVSWTIAMEIVLGAAPVGSLGLPAAFLFRLALLELKEQLGKTPR